jgi:flagellar assembly factor FliW
MRYGSNEVSRAVEEGAIVSQSFAEMREDAPRNGVQEIETRFGKVIVNHDAPFFFEKGVLGMPEKRYFSLLDFPVKKFFQFKLLQCLDDHALSFIVMPLARQNPIIAEKDLLDAATDLDISPDALATYLIVNVYREMNMVRMSANARAPLFVNIRTHQAAQSVLRNNAYLVRHLLTGELATPFS